MTEINESAFRSDLRKLSSMGSETPLPPDFLHRVQRFKARRRRRVAIFGAAGTLAVVAVSAGLASAFGGSTRVPRPTSPIVGAPVCPPRVPQFTALPGGRAGLGQRLVPEMPSSGTACDFKDGSLAKSQPLSEAQLKAVTDALDRPVTTYPFRCPRSPEPTLLLAFGYASGPEVQVLIATNCPNLTNGVLSGALNREGILPPELSRLLPSSQ